jgi:hypothetical protein
VVLQSTPLPALASQHTICWLYLNVCIQIANKLGNKKKIMYQKLADLHFDILKHRAYSP